ncbi:MAG TPA: S8 family serine peptidase [Thermoanaerobaculia bacterium]|jgi:endonuclease G|nr:S8 family serine peptidase [Thermoanaerobaculia bacterium]
MPTVYVIHAEDDRPFVERLLRILPRHGYERWSSRDSVPAGSDISTAISEAIRESDLVLAVLSRTSMRSESIAAEIDIALHNDRPLIPVWLDAADRREVALAPALRALHGVDFSIEEEGEAERLLAALLPAAEQRSSNAPAYARRIAWDEASFTASLREATWRHDHGRAESLVRTMVNDLASRPDAYPEKAAAADLLELRQEREFDLMRQYGEAVIASGTRKDKVRKLFAQSLIETRAYDRALAELESIIQDPESSQREVFEAHGLIGRTNKQQYVDAPDAPQAAEWIRNAIAAYETVYERDHSQFWHGVNAASCMLRAQRDGVDVGSRPRAQEIAQQVLEQLDELRQAGPLEVWDAASRVEALLALERHDEAEAALDPYINHPDMRAFEVSSTFRQFDQVLQLGRQPRGAAILERLRRTVQRYRAGSVVAGTAGAVDTEIKPLVIRVNDPNWQPATVSDLVVRTRMGTIITAHGSAATVRELLTDPTVISIEESQPAGAIECDRSLPFINVAAQYPGASGPYSETGDGALVAVIDDGIDVLHEAFLDAAGQSRIVGIWDQRGTCGPPPANYDYGTFHDAAAVAGYVSARAVPPELAKKPGRHGTHVSSIAAGRAAGAFTGGVAPDAKLLMVISAAGGSIGYSQTHIDALGFIDAFATALALPVVVNVSQGMNAGAHDGKSALEVAFDAFSESGRKAGRVVVKSAGNERGKNGRAYVTVPPFGAETLRFKRAPTAAATERIELWSSSSDEFEFRLRDPFQEWSPSVSTASPDVSGTFALGGAFHLVFTKRHVDNGDSLLLIELGTPSTPAATDDWTLEITSRTVPEGGDIHCWIERRGGTPTVFLDHISEEMTLSIPGTASSVIAVAAVDACQPIQVGTFSSYGPTRDQQKKPLVSAPGVNVNAASTGTGNGVHPDSGTSMAAPHVAGAIALVLSRTAKSGRAAAGNQIASALRQKTQHYNGRWDRGRGYGVIDVSALLGAF